MGKKVGQEDGIEGRESRKGQEEGTGGRERRESAIRACRGRTLNVGASCLTLVMWAMRGEPHLTTPNSVQPRFPS